MAYDNDNIFAKILRSEAPAFTVHEDEHCIAILDVMPQADGHTLVLPRATAENLFDLEAADASHLIRTTQLVARAVQSAFQPDGLRLMQFNGSAAGQTVFHFHMHIIPCFSGQQLRGHGRGMANENTLTEHAERICAKLAT
ncbi:MAG: HIT family protein [Gammaproteobacteria bacterium]